MKIKPSKIYKLSACYMLGGLKRKIMFKNGNQTPAYGNEKRASDMIIELQDKNATLRLALGKLLKLCEETKMQDQSETWRHIMGEAKEAIHDTDPNK